MHRIDDPTAVPTLPAPRAPGVPGYFTGGSPGSSGFAATVVRYEFMNSLQEELSHVVEAAGLTLNKTDNTQLFQALQKLFVYRTFVTQNMTIYVNPTTGNDANNGLTAGTAFLTIQAAINSVYRNYDWNGHSCTIQLADGTYNYTTVAGYAAMFSYFPFGMTQGGLRLNGNQPSPQNVRIVATNANCVSVFGGNVGFSGLTLNATGNVNTIYANQGLGVAVNAGAWADFQNCRFETCGQGQITCGNGSVCTLQGTGNQFTGTTGFSLGESCGGQIWFPGATFNVTGLTVTTGFVYATEAGTINGQGASFIGSAIGPKYSVALNGIISTNGGGANYFPGSTPGVSSTGGQYQ